MNFIKTIFIILFTFLSSSAFADQHDLNSNNQTTAQTTEINNENEDIEEEVPLNDPFAGNEGTGSGSNIPEEEQENEMSLYNFKLVGLISGKDNSYISLVNSSGEVITLSLSQYLGDIKLVDLRLNEAIFEKDDKTFIIIDFNNQIRRQMNIKELLNSIFITVFFVVFLTGCQTVNKSKKPFQHNTPLIKDDIKSEGKAEIAKTLEMGPKPVEGDVKKLQKRKNII